MKNEEIAELNKRQKKGKRRSLCLPHYASSSNIILVLKLDLDQRFDSLQILLVPPRQKHCEFKGTVSRLS